MATVNITESNIEASLAEGTVVLDFWASWCGPCRAFAPVFEAASERHPDVTFGKVDTEAEPGLARAFRVRAIPTLVVLRDGVLLFEQAGMLPPAAIDEILEKVAELDMESVKQEIESSKQAATSEQVGGA